MAVDPGFWYVRDDSPISSFTGATAETGGPGSVGWSAITAWAATTSIAPGSIRRQTAAAFSGTGSRSGTTLTIATVVSGGIYLGQAMFTNAGTALGTITALGTGTGGVGTYTTSGTGTVAAATTINGGFVQGNQLAFIATQAAAQNTGATEPNWSAASARGATFTDGSVTWVECSGHPGVNGDITNTLTWTQSKAVSTTPGRGSIIKDAAGTHLFIQTSAAGTVGGSEPSWNFAAVGNTTTDNTVTWTYIGTSFAAWAAPLSTITQASTWIGNGDTIYVGDDHSENYGALATISPSSTPALVLILLSIDHTASHPPGSGNLLAGAKITAVNSVSLSISYAYWYGWTFDGGVGASNAVGVSIAIADGTSKFDTCTFKLSSTNTGSQIILGNAGNGSLEFIDCTNVFQNATQRLAADCGHLLWRGGSIITGGATPTTLITSATNQQGVAVFEGVDLSGISGTLVPANALAADSVSFGFVDCKLNASVTLSATPATRSVGTDVIRCSSDSKTYIQRRYTYAGTLLEETTIIRTGGASDNVTGISWGITTTANSKWIMPFDAFPIAIWNPTTGSDVIVTLYGIWNAAVVPNKDEIWVEVEYLGDTTPTALGKYKSGSKTNILASGSGQAADTSAWDSLVTARQNTHAYSVGDVYKSANNSGRIFFVTTAGTSSGSEPGGIASAVDGGSVTDGTAIVRAGVRFTMTVTLTSTQPQLVGYLKARVKAAKASSTFYIDPAIALS